ncbi:MAG TPA: 3-phosphoserine/phosphohydroxythreonine transaminase [Nocardioidaceae bacterium]|nr:3-phosphoserine/phosphohydroxythreonine transaminase [Nocardioidaceae bacterium]
MKRVRNFCAGPCTLPVEVLTEVQAELLDYQGSGMSLIEMSHRSAEYDEVHGEALERLRSALDVPDDFEVLFVQGGAMLQFAMVPMNLLAAGSTAGYVRSGAWGKAAYADAERAASVYLAWDGTEGRFTRMPRADDIKVRAGTRYVHLTSNETIEGIQLHTLPALDVPLVVDISSDFLTQPIDWQQVDLAYGGVQKNLGPAGLAVVVIRRSALEGGVTGLPAYLGYSGHAGARSLLNTPPMFSVYVVGKMLRWIEDRGGLAGMAERAARRSGLVYEVLDTSDGFYTGPAEADARSRTNVVFRLASPELDDRFLADARDAGLVNLKGHRSVGGFRASIYNAMPDEGVDELVEFMRSFAQSTG